MPDLDSPTADQARLAVDVQQLRRHATWLERVAAMVLAFAATTAAVALIATLAAWLAVGLLLAGTISWGLLRTVALLVRLRADEAALALPVGIAPVA